MSTLNVNQINNAAGTGQPNISGLSKAWVNFNGTGTVAIRGNYNVSSITDNGTGDYTINFSSALSDANYSAVMSAVKYTQSTATNDTTIINIQATSAQTASSFRITAKYSAGGGGMASFDCELISAACFR